MLTPDGHLLVRLSGVVVAVQDLAGDILVRGILRRRENDHFVEDIGEAWHTDETHDMDVYTGDGLIDRVVLD